MSETMSILNIQTASRLGQVEEYYFSRKLREIAQMRAEGKDIINLGIGSPDLPPAPEVIDILHDSSSSAGNHGYQSYVGIPELRQAFADWYKKWFDVELDANSEVLPLIGSKEGIMHISMTYLEAGDEVLVPNPGYPTYSSVARLTGATIRHYDLGAETGWFPDLEALEREDLSKVKIMWINYPNMPTGTPASQEFFTDLVEFARRNEILIINDNPYAFILNEQPLSLLSIPGAKDVAMELNSLSKSHNMAGWRAGMLAGRKEFLENVLRFKSNMDSGMFRPLQLAAAKALSLPDSWYRDLNEIYTKRRNKVFALLDQLECTYRKDQVGMFVWAEIPEYYPNGYTLSDKVLDEAHVFITPGGIFGSHGMPYVRISLCSTEEVFTEALNRIKSAF